MEQSRTAKVEGNLIFLKFKFKIMKIQKCFWKILILLEFIIAVNGVEAQNNCNTAVTLTNNYCTEYQFQNSQYYWISFTADTLAYFFNIMSPANTPVANVTDIFLYSGTCNNLKLINTQKLFGFFKK